MSAFPGLITKLRTRRLLWTGSALRNYAKEPPSPQLAVDIFRGEWASKMPPPLQEVRAGETPLFQDERIGWGIQQLGGVEGLRVLELGPLDGGHTYMLHQAGAREVVAVEAHRRAFLRCLLVKELFRLDRVHFLHGDFVSYLRNTAETFDVCVASGVLYHMTNPVELIGLLARRAEKVFIWTHYFDPAGAAHSRRFRSRSAGTSDSIEDGFRHSLHARRYGYSLFSAGFCGGSTRRTHWLNRADLMGALAHYGFSDVEVAFDLIDHPNGPALALVAKRS